MKMKTKSTVARRRVKRRQDRVSHKKLRTLRSRKYARKTARKIGGAGSAGYGSMYIDDGWNDEDEDNNSSNNSNKEIFGFGALLYDYIPVPTPFIDHYNLPICVFFIRNMTLVNDHVYIFFNKNVTADEITLIVKHYLGIESDDFSINPPITVSGHTKHVWEGNLDNLWEFLGDTFVKLSKCEIMSNKYCLETGVFEPNTPLFKVKTKPHKMTSNGKEVEIKTRSRDEIKKLFESDGDFRKKIPQMSTTIQPDLYKSYIDGVISENKHLENVSDKTKQDLKKKAEKRSLKVTYSSITYSDTLTPKDIVINFQNGLQKSWFTIAKKLKTITDAEDAAAWAANVWNQSVSNNNNN